MITGKMSLRDLMQGAWKFLMMKTGKTLFGVNLEVTHRCNLRCNSCNFWQQSGKEKRLNEYASIIHRLNPLHISITGGEPLIRNDLETIIRDIREQTTFVYMNLITNGSLLTVRRALSLWNAGLNQITVSLDFPDQRHDAHRGYPDLWRQLKRLLPQLATTEIDNLCLNTVIMKENVGSLLEIVQTAKQWGYKVSFSTYNPHKNDNPGHVVPEEQIASLEDMIEALIRWKRRHGNITNSDYYLKRIPRYFRNGGIPGCLAGKKWVQLGPDGILRRCADTEVLGNWREFKSKKIPMTSCTQCWYACRGEAEAPLGIKRIVELNR